MQQIFEKNRQAVEIARVKEEIETQITSSNPSGTSDDDLQRLHSDLDALLLHYERLVSQKLSLFADLLENLREITRSNESVICAEEEIARLRTNMDFVKRDIHQKKRLLDDQTSIMDELRRELRELDEELAGRDSRIQEMEEQIKCKDFELEDLEDLIMHKDRTIGQMQQELV